MGREEELWGKKDDVTDSHEFRRNIGKAQPRKLNKMENPYEPDCVYITTI